MAPPAWAAWTWDTKHHSKKETPAPRGFYVSGLTSRKMCAIFILRYRESYFPALGRRALGSNAFQSRRKSTLKIERVDDMEKCISRWLVVQCWTALLPCFIMGCATDEGVGSGQQGIVISSDWRDRISGSPDVHLVSLPQTLNSYLDAWVYQFGDNYPTWVAHVGDHNKECGPASVQIIERLTGRSNVKCSFQQVVSGCEDYPNVHSACRAVGACGHIAGGFPNSSTIGNENWNMQPVLESLGYEVTNYHRSTTPISLALVKQAIDRNHPVIVALSPRSYDLEVNYDSSGVDSHYVVVVGYGSVCENPRYRSGYVGDLPSGFVYMLDPGWQSGSRYICISEETFNRALEDEYNPSSYSGLEVARPGFDGLPNATWYPPGSLLRVGGEYYYVTKPDWTGVPRYFHTSSIDVLAANRLNVSRAIDASPSSLGCMFSLGDLDTARRFREYRESSGTIYLIDVVERKRYAFLNGDAYVTHMGRDDWRFATADEIRIWSRYPRGEIGLAPGTLVMSDRPGVSTIWVVSMNDAGILRLPIVNWRTAEVYGYDDALSHVAFGGGVVVQVHDPDLDRLAGPEGQLLTEEMARDCQARRCLAAVDCFTTGSSIGGGGEGGAVGDGACGSCGSEAPPPPPSGCAVHTDCPRNAFCESGSCVVRDRDGDGWRDDECVPDDPTSYPGAPELCDSRDNDCDGIVDGPVPVRSSTNACGMLTEACFGGSWVVYDGRIPSPEVCNAGDDDCDGLVDEDNVCGTTPPPPPPPPACVPVTETCNNRDDDCDGIVDRFSEACSTACESGVRACVAGVWSACTARAPAPESCNGVDDDCDGTVDEGVCSAPIDPRLVRIRLSAYARGMCSAGWRILLWLSSPAEESAPDEELELIVTRTEEWSSITLLCSSLTPAWYTWDPARHDALGSEMFDELSMGGVDLRSTTLICEDPYSLGTGFRPIMMWDPARRGSCPP